MTNNLLVDTSFLYALADPADKHRAEAINFARHSTAKRLVPDVVLPEVTYLLQRSVAHIAAIRFLKLLAASEAELVPVTMGDVERAAEIMEAYSDARLDFVDCCIMALSERLNVTQVCTFDRRDFVVFRPKHCDYLELLP